MKRDVQVPGDPGPSPPEPAGAVASNPAPLHGVEEVRREYEIGIDLGREPAWTAPAPSDAVRVRDKAGGGIIAHRYGLSFAESDTTDAPRSAAEQLVADYPDRFEIL